jgi:hypothetical protein
LPGEIEAPHDFAGDIFRGIFRPMLGSVEDDDADRVLVLAGYHGGFDIGASDIGFGANRRAKSDLASRSGRGRRADRVTFPGG